MPVIHLLSGEKQSERVLAQMKEETSQAMADQVLNNSTRPDHTLLPNCSSLP
jgi:dephospho-CoA kinase